MEHTRRQVAHWEGLQEGLGVDGDVREGKLWIGLLAVLHAVERDLAALAARDRSLEGYIGELDESLREIEDIFFEPPDQSASQGQESSAGSSENGQPAGAIRAPRSPRPLGRR